MRINRDKLNLLLIILFFLSDSRLFYLIPFPNVLGGTASNKTLVGSVALICFAIYLVTNHGKIKLQNYGKTIFNFFIILIIQGIYEKFEYGYAFSTILFSMIPYFCLLMYFPIFDVCKSNFDKILNIMEYVTIILGALLLTQAFIYDRTHHIFLNFTISDWYTIYHPNAKGRFYTVAEGFVKCMSLISFYKILDKVNGEKEFIHYLSLVMSILMIVFVDQSRIYLITELICVLIMYFIIDIRKLTLEKVLGFISILFIVMIIVIRKIFTIIGTIGDLSDGSYYARTDAISYYAHTLTGFQKILGLGIVIPSEGTMGFSLIKGPLGIYNYDDIGLMGIFASLGIVGVVWYIYIMSKNFALSKKVNDLYLRGLSFGLTYLMVFSAFTLSYLDKERIMALLLTMVIIDHAYYESSKKQGEINGSDYYN